MREESVNNLFADWGRRWGRRARTVASALKARSARRWRAHEHACLEVLRAELRRSYPKLEPDRLLNIAREHRLLQFPEGFLVAGDVSSEAQPNLEAMARADATSAQLHPLFSAAFYLLLYPDVAAAGVPAWLHYQVHGRAEGRSPHPLIDVDFLAVSVPEIPRQYLVDHYLSDPALWTADPGPYVECRRFMLAGKWDAATNPLLQIVAGQIGGPWIHERLLLVDSSSDDAAQARLTAAGYLLGVDTRSRLATVRLWPRTLSEPDASDRFTVVPGYFLGSLDRSHALTSTSVVSPDRTFVTLATELLSLTTGEEIQSSALIFIEGDQEHATLRKTVAAAQLGAAIATHSSVQAEALALIIEKLDRGDLRLLRCGYQTTVITPTLVRIAAAAAPKVQLWNSGTAATNVARSAAAASSAATIIVLPESHWKLATADFAIRTAISGGASLCLVGASGWAPWHRVLEHHEAIVCHPSLLSAATSFVSLDRIFDLQTEVGL